MEDTGTAVARPWQCQHSDRRLLFQQAGASPGPGFWRQRRFSGHPGMATLLGHLQAPPGLGPRRL